MRLLQRLLARLFSDAVEEGTPTHFAGLDASTGLALAQVWQICVGRQKEPERGEVRWHVNVFADDESIRLIGGLDAPVGEGSSIYILAAVSGG